VFICGENDFSMTREEKLRQADQTLRRLVLEQEIAPPLPSGPTADVYRIANYSDGLVGANGCDALRPHYNSGLRWADKNNIKPDDPLWGRGVAGGVRWDGTFYRDLTRFANSGPLFWCAYLKPGSAAGMKGGYWLNFGSGWSHLQNDDLSQMLAGASQRIYYDSIAKRWTLVIEATMFVTLAIVEVWRGMKSGGTDPVGTYTRISGCDPLAELTVQVN
jgi:hypothetical protein